MKNKVIGIAIVAAMLVPHSTAVAQAEAPDHVARTGERFSTTYGFPSFDWSGHEWAVRQTEGTLNFGGPQAEDPADGRAKWVNGAHVMPNGDLKIRNEGIRGGVEINAVDSTGYGTYFFEYSADFDKMDPHNVLGIFPYDMAELELNKVDEVHKNANGSTEIDFIEISRWGSVDRALPHGGVTYYPDTAERPNRYNIDQFDVPAGQQTLTTVAEWEKDYLRVVTRTASGEVLSDITSTTRIPCDTGTQQLRINLWTTPSNKSEHKTAEGDEITFHDYGYTPKIGTGAEEAAQHDDGNASAAPAQSASSEASADRDDAVAANPSVDPEAPEAPGAEADHPSAAPGEPEAEAPEAAKDHPSVAPGEPEAEAPEAAKDHPSAAPGEPAPAEGEAGNAEGDFATSTETAENEAPQIQPESELYDPEEKLDRAEKKFLKAIEKGKDRGSSNQGFFNWLFTGARNFFSLFRF